MSMLPKDVQGKIDQLDQIRALWTEAKLLPSDIAYRRDFFAKDFSLKPEEFDIVLAGLLGNRRFRSVSRISLDGVERLARQGWERIRSALAKSARSGGITADFYLSNDSQQHEVQDNLPALVLDAALRLERRKALNQVISLPGMLS